ncbi:hypothetical protein T4E_5311 [Trichinella pseudospiralis]|uniref:Uncharacterized protein n=1 Tax=Trichinella pseudospiralis TaxID=6337 RepID=A0A0V0YL14_TRIPS|nr:hypothetical protein T4E_5311 [Trichinella pseudospiralis]
MSTGARYKSKKLIIYKERLNWLFKELYQLWRLFRETDALQVEFEVDLEEEDRMMAEDDWSKYQKGFRERKARALALMRSNRTDEPGRLDDKDLTSVKIWATDVVAAATSVHELTTRLSRCYLPKFSGDFRELRAFWDQFDYRVHQRKDLSKLTYLCGCLTGKAADVISSLSSSNVDYEVALKRLCEEFDRPAKVIRHQIKISCKRHQRTWDLRKGGLQEGELFADEITIAISRDQIPTPVRIKWHEKTKANETMAADMSEYLRFMGEQAEFLEESRSDRTAKPTQPEAKRRSSPLRRRHDGATFLHAAIASWLDGNEESPRAAEISELGRPTPQESTRAAPRVTRPRLASRHDISFDGNRYSVGLLWKRGMASLPNNYATAIRRYRSLEKLLSRDPVLDQDYTTVVQSYLDNGWAEEAPASRTPGKTCLFGGALRSLSERSVGVRTESPRRTRNPAAFSSLPGWTTGGHRKDEYRLRRVCFGLTCSPFLAIQTTGRMPRGVSMRLGQHRGDEGFNEAVEESVRQRWIQSDRVREQLLRRRAIRRNCRSEVTQSRQGDFGRRDPTLDRHSFRQPEVNADAQDTKILSLAAAVFGPFGYSTFVPRLPGGELERQPDGFGEQRLPFFQVGSWKLLEFSFSWMRVRSEDLRSKMWMQLWKADTGHCVVLAVYLQCKIAGVAAMKGPWSDWSHRSKDLQQFNPCLDEDGIRRVGGRLAQELPLSCLRRSEITFYSLSNECNTSNTSTIRKYNDTLSKIATLKKKTSEEHQSGESNSEASLLSYVVQPTRVTVAELDGQARVKLNLTINGGVAGDDQRNCRAECFLPKRECGSKINSDGDDQAAKNIAVVDPSSAVT